MKRLLFSIIVVSLSLTSIAHAQAATLLVDFAASPASGLTPLNNVDLSASVSGSATGPITYRFDCTGDGVWDTTYTSTNTSYTAPDLCNYQAPGIYTAKAMVERGGLSFQGSIGVNVTGVVPATSVSTGLFNPSIIALAITFLIGFIISYFLLLRFYVKNHVLPKAFQQKAVQDIESVIKRIKQREEPLI